MRLSKFLRLYRQGKITQSALELLEVDDILNQLHEFKRYCFLWTWFWAVIIGLCVLWSVALTLFPKSAFGVVILVTFVALIGLLDFNGSKPLEGYANEYVKKIKKNLRNWCSWLEVSEGFFLFVSKGDLKKQADKILISLAKDAISLEKAESFEGAALAKAHFKLMHRNFLRGKLVEESWDRFFALANIDEGESKKSSSEHRCTNKECNALLDSAARFCQRCGTQKA
jgi:hypothetical protein